MSHTTPARRTASALAASALLALVVAAPAVARQDPGTGEQHPRTTTVRGGSVDHEGLRPPQAPGAGASKDAARLTAVDDDAVEYLQIGAGILAGVALAGAGAAAMSRRHHRQPSPA